MRVGCVQQIWKSQYHAWYHRHKIIANLLSCTSTHLHIILVVVAFVMIILACTLVIILSYLHLCVVHDRAVSEVALIGWGCLQRSGWVVPSHLCQCAEMNAVGA